MVRFLPFLISLVLSVYALFSCIQTPDEDVPHLPKLVWILLIVFVPFVGPIVWLLMSRNQGSSRERSVRPPRPGSRATAPDDDPDFLKSLDRYRDPRTTVKPPDKPEPEPKPEPDPKPEAESEPEPESGPTAKDTDPETSSETDDGKT